MDRDLHYPLQRIVGGLFVVGGLWHAASPWTQRYADIPLAVTNNVASGLALATVGLLVMLFRGARVLNWAAGAIGLWVIVSPAILGIHNWMALNQAYWGGAITLVLMAIASYDLRFHRPIDQMERAAEREAALREREVTSTAFGGEIVPGSAANRAKVAFFRFVPTRVNAVMDYLWAVLVIAMPWLLGYDTMFAVAIAPALVGLFVIFYSLFTQYEYGVWGVFTMRNHLWMDFGAGLFLALSPWIFGFAQTVWIPHVAFGAFAIVGAIFTSTAPRWSVATAEWFPEPRDYPLMSH